MPKPRVYVETTIPSFYYDTRTDPAVVSRRRWTRQWWAAASARYELITGAPVLAELAAGTSSRARLRMQLLDGLPVLVPDGIVLGVVDTYLRHKLMPAQPPDDALHLALASTRECDFIVTWNCKHLANPNKFAHIRRNNGLLGLRVPNLVTPLDLLGRER